MLLLLARWSSWLQFHLSPLSLSLSLRLLFIAHSSEFMAASAARKTIALWLSPLTGSSQ